jgi:hypothetical protein
MQPVHELTPLQYLACEADQQGVCLYCGTWSGGTDPGVGRARCAACGSNTLHRVEQALLLGAVQTRR